MAKRVVLDVRPNGVATLKMNDVENKNAFSAEFAEELIHGLDALENEHAPKVVVLSGLPDVFCAGAEKKGLLDLCDGKVVVKDLLISEKLLSVPFPVIAAMEGHALGGGLVMGLCCDIVIAAKESRYGAVFMSMGFTPGMGCTKLLEEMVGPYLAAEMMFTGRRMRGSELEGKRTHINYILSKSEVRAKADDVALQIAEKNIKSLYLLKNVLSARKRKLLVDARVQEDLMHRLSFSFPETRKTIEELYGG
jgi:polyketide biosynthesis enoyl-CoA hydratase PksI